VEIAYTPTNSSCLNRIEAQFTALREFTLNGTDHGSHREQGSTIRRYIAWRNRNTATTHDYARSSRGQTWPDAALADRPPGGASTVRSRTSAAVLMANSLVSRSASTAHAGRLRSRASSSRADAPTLP
jgi:hypothetical protein